MLSNKYKYVVSVGCSFTASDYEEWDEVFKGVNNLVNPGETYGDVVAEHFGAKFYNLAKSGGSLQRTNRKILEWCSKNTDKFEDTLIIIGMNELSRLEFWVNEKNKFLQKTLNNQINQYGVFGMKFSKEQIVNFYNDKPLFLIATNMIIGLQSFLTLNNIDHIFFDALNPIEKYCDSEKKDELWDNLVSQENWYKHPEYESMIDFTSKNSEMRYSDEDSHPNKKGHKYWAECLLEHINVI
tara:strand:+ start:58 stop:777 length:720 start_codon:yes stop_codon:yes gene_type:complete